MAPSSARLAIVVPCYNEESVLPVMAPYFLEKLSQLMEAGLCDADSRIVFVDDGSRDSTWSIISTLAHDNEAIEGVKLSCNRGHQNALLCGLMQAKDSFDVTISIDCDGQDSLDAMDEMLARYHEGYDVVYGVRSSRETDTWFKRTTAQGFYKVLSLMGVDSVYNHADYRLLSKRALDYFSDYHETNLFLRGMVPLVGFKSTSVEYSRAERVAGESHYPLSKMIHLAIDGITSLSIEPIHMVMRLGMLFCFVGLLGLIIAAIMKTNSLLPFMVLLLMLFSGLNFVALGIIGEYVGKSYLEIKHRPRWIVETSTLGPINRDNFQ